MHNTQESDELALVGVVPRRRAQSIDSLLSDTPAHWPVSDEIESTRPGRTPALSHWLSGVAAFGMVAAALEWLKLTR